MQRRRLSRRKATLAFAALSTLTLANPPRAVHAQTQSAATLPFQNPNLSISARVDDLISRMTLEEKVSQMQTDAKAIPRLGIPAYYWWSESLHGDANAGIATVFPQAIGLASTWDTDLHFQVATVTSDENRAHYNRTVEEGRPRAFQGLTFFAPNINIFRDPRWGRGQETYGEDPYLTGRFAVAFIKGMQGDDPKYLKVAATAKHFAVHSGPEPERHVFDAVVSPYDLHDTYLPAFEAAVREGQVESVMGAYSSLLGVPDCASPLLLQQNLRDAWGFKGYVVSDCGAIGDIFYSHHYAKSVEAGDADAVKAGTDLDCGGTYGALVGAVRQGLITEAEIDRSVKRLFSTRFKLGMFDPPTQVRYAQIPYSTIDSPAHQALALRAAQESIVLLKNDKHTLPFGKTIKSIAVIGPNADSVPVLVGNYNGTPSHPVTILDGLQRRADAAGVKLEYVQGVGLTDTNVALPAVPTSALSSGGQPGLKGEYWNNIDFSGAPALTRTDKQIRFDFGETGPGGSGIGGQNYAARWTGTLTAPKDGTYTIGVKGDDGYRLFLNNEKVAEDWGIHPPTTKTTTIALKAGQQVPLKIEYYQGEGGAEVTLMWQVPADKPAAGAKPYADAVAAARRADAVVYVCGLTAQLEGEEGTNGGGDRKDLNLPGQQEPLLEALQAAGKPVVVVLMNGSALGVTWAKAHDDAIVEAWYPGEAGGDAVAQALFGDFSPAGRLPVTFYTSTDQLPPFRDYAMVGRTYRYFDGAPLYPFGYGLSYTTFRYRDLNAPRQVRAGKPLTVTATVENTGSVASDEVAELYLRPAPTTDAAKRRIGTGTQPMPRLVLGGFQRLHLAPGEKRTLTFTVKPEQMLLIDEKGERTLQPGAWEAYVGGGQPEIGKREGGKDVLAQEIQIK